MLQGFGLWRSLDVNPSIQTVAGDAEEYWNLAGDIADGQLVGETPFLSAPLYPYFVGLIRALGGGMTSVFVLQLLMRSLTAWLLAKGASRLFGHLGFGLATAVAYLWLQEPAYYAVRLLNSSLQLLTLSALVYAAIAWRDAWNPKRSLGLGALLGVCILSNPGLLITVPFFAWWLGLRGPQLKQTAMALGMTFLCIAPATLHNALATADSPVGTEFILLSAQAGVTFSHGNAPGAVGTYKPMEGVSMNRAEQNADAFQLATEATGESGWGNTSSFFFEKGLDYLMANPGDAIALEFAKLRWFFCGRNYGDLYNINLENSDPEWPRQVPLPGGLLELGWILPAAFLGVILLLRRDRKYAIPIVAPLLATLFVVMVFWYSPRYRLPAAPIAALLAPWAIWEAARLVGRSKSVVAILATLFVVMVFWYSPRYRLPAAPIAALLAPWAIWEAARLVGRSKSVVAIALLAILPGAILESWSRASHFDPFDDVRAQYDLNIGLQRIVNKEFALALPRLEAALAGGVVRADLHSGMAECFVQQGTQLDQQGPSTRAAADALYLKAIEQYRKAMEINPARLDTGFSLGSVLAFMQKPEEARTVLLASIEEAQKQNNTEMLARLRQMLASLK